MQSHREVRWGRDGGNIPVMCTQWKLINVRLTLCNSPPAWLKPALSQRNDSFFPLDLFTGRCVQLHCLFPSPEACKMESGWANVNVWHNGLGFYWDNSFIILLWNKLLWICNSCVCWNWSIHCQIFGLFRFMNTQMLISNLCQFIDIEVCYSVHVHARVCLCVFFSAIWLHVVSLQSTGHEKRGYAHLSAVLSRGVPCRILTKPPRGRVCVVVSLHCTCVYMHVHCRSQLPRALQPGESKAFTMAWHMLE